MLNSPSYRFLLSVSPFHLQPVGFVTFDSRAGAESAKQALSVSTHAKATNGESETILELIFQCITRSWGSRKCETRLKQRDLDPFFRSKSFLPKEHMLGFNFVPSGAENVTFNGFSQLVREHKMGRGHRLPWSVLMSKVMDRGTFFV